MDPLVDQYLLSCINSGRTGTNDNYILNLFEIHELIIFLNSNHFYVINFCSEVSIVGIGGGGDTTGA